MAKGQANQAVAEQPKEVERLPVGNQYARPKKKPQPDDFQRNRPHGPAPKEWEGQADESLQTFRVSLPKHKSLLHDEGRPYYVDAMDIRANNKFEAVELFFHFNGIRETVHQPEVEQVA